MFLFHGPITNKLRTFRCTTGNCRIFNKHFTIKWQTNLNSVFLYKIGKEGKKRRGKKLVGDVCFPSLSVVGEVCFSSLQFIFLIFQPKELIKPQISSLFRFSPIQTCILLVHNSSSYDRRRLFGCIKQMTLQLTSYQKIHKIDNLVPIKRVFN